MKRLIRNSKSVWVAIFVAISLVMLPGNASAMIQCDEKPVFEQTLEHPGHGFGTEQAIDTAMDSVAHLGEHCVNHVCVVAVDTAFYPTFVSTDWTAIALAGPAESIIDDFRAPGLRRPPRS